MEISTFIEEYSPCYDGREWLITQNSLYDAWKNCDNVMWLSWFYFWRNYSVIPCAKFYNHIWRHFQANCSKFNLETSYAIMLKRGSIPACIDSVLAGLMVENGGDFEDYEICTIIRDFMGYPFGE